MSIRKFFKRIGRKLGVRQKEDSYAKQYAILTSALAYDPRKEEENEENLLKVLQKVGSRQLHAMAASIFVEDNEGLSEDVYHSMHRELQLPYLDEAIRRELDA